MTPTPPHSPRRSNAPIGWHSRGYLPHFNSGSEFIQFITFRLADAVPTAAIARWKDELLARPESEREAELHRLIERYLDTGCGACHLRDRRIAELVRAALFHFDSTRYRLHSWVVMPNHIHALIAPLERWTLSEILHSWKWYSANKANKLLGRTGTFWQADYFDRYIRDEAHYHSVVEYIELNPVKAGLCSEASLWEFGSASTRLAQAR